MKSQSKRCRQEMLAHLEQRESQGSLIVENEVESKGK